MILASSPTPLSAQQRTRGAKKQGAAIRSQSQRGCCLCPSVSFVPWVSFVPRSWGVPEAGTNASPCPSACSCSPSLQEAGATHTNPGTPRSLLLRQHLRGSRFPHCCSLMEPNCFCPLGGGRGAERRNKKKKEKKNKVKFKLMNYYISERHVTERGSSGGW